MTAITVLLPLLLAADPVGFRCDLPAARDEVPRIAACSDAVAYDPGLDAIRKTDPERFDRAVTESTTLNTNLGAATFPFGTGKKVVFRSSFLSRSPACVEELVGRRGVGTVVNLYTGDLQSAADLTVEEQALFRKAGLRSYLQVLGYDYKFSHLRGEERAARKAEIVGRIAEVVRQVAAAPGNVLIHCYGGIHRTGLVFGIMQKCLAHVPLDRILEEYRCHAGWKSEEARGGADPQNEEILRDFDCALLSTVAASTPGSGPASRGTEPPTAPMAH